MTHMSQSLYLRERPGVLFFIMINANEKNDETCCYMRIQTLCCNTISEVFYVDELVVYDYTSAVASD